MKKTIYIIVITAIVVLIVTYGGFKVVHATGKAPFCGSCHEWDGAIAQTNLADTVHGPSNPKGVVVTCTDCHLPHDSIAGYLFTKAKNGISEGITTFITGDPAKKDWLANREHARANYTFDSSCMRCHENAFSGVDGNKTSEISQMHAKYIEFKGTSEAMKCTDCHMHVGHKDLGKTLFDIKDTKPKTWEEWDIQRAKMLKEKK
ncbi:cytochrome c3 family protein [Campylobacter geochelonis]|uniref:Cytochrome c-type protein n=1 Tax=Campylobacter geochelonis TaxID=1780362 RepID=A0A128EPG3_9BACT|nr:NapC/NirT family cytochrome c [Campylobacter geochelonis]QKF70844.1 NapC/NirT cytochrome c family protein [Campylobacter geochelonis]CZE47456.1 putative tetraheme cytochrome c [Campylobacter geochelonis]CZE48027.1 putative tetraheme cytochrome c [Campylobacter geochelonis]CZE50609.1 putative tetraheme cytochrome c [Campylobacter geochelonis]